MDQFRLISVHKGKPLPSIKFVFTGTKKIVWLASYIVEALEQGKTLILDELDSGLQFKLSRALISLFNNPINVSAQLICMTHDVSLLDIKTLLRKDQIWLPSRSLMCIFRVYNCQLRMLRHPLFVAIRGKMRYNISKTREGYICLKNYMRKARFGLR